MLQRSEPKNRVASDLATWKRIEGKLVERYGKKIQYDRDFLKAKRDIYRHISNKHKDNRRKLNLYEKAELKVLRGQQRSLLRQIYPNPFVRLTRNLLVFAGNLVIFPLKAATSVLKTLFTFPERTVAPYAPRPAQVPSRQQTQQQSQGEGQKPVLRSIPSQKNTQEQSKAITRKMPVKSRVQVPARQTKSVRL